jgi:hypothetical protein
MEIAPDAFIFPVALIVIFGVVVFAARRFARRREREGQWDSKGPVDPSLPPVDFLQGIPQPWGISRPTIESEDEGEDEVPPTDHHHHHHDR